MRTVRWQEGIGIPRSVDMNPSIALAAFLGYEEYGILNKVAYLGGGWGALVGCTTGHIRVFPLADKRVDFGHEVPTFDEMEAAKAFIEREFPEAFLGCTDDLSLDA